MEGIKDPVKFKEVLKQAALVRKPVVILKVGKTSKGSALAASHTGVLRDLTKHLMQSPKIRCYPGG